MLWSSRELRIHLTLRELRYEFTTVPDIDYGLEGLDKSAGTCNFTFAARDGVREWTKLLSDISQLVQMYMFTSAQVFLLFRSEYTLYTCSCTVGENQVPFSMADFLMYHEKVLAGIS